MVIKHSLTMQSCRDSSRSVSSRLCKMNSPADFFCSRTRTRGRWAAGPELQLKELRHDLLLRHDYVELRPHPYYFNSPFFNHFERIAKSVLIIKLFPFFGNNILVIELQDNMQKEESVKVQMWERAIA